MFREEAKFLGWLWFSFILLGLLAALILPNFIRSREDKFPSDNTQGATENKEGQSSVHP